MERDCVAVRAGVLVSSDERMGERAADALRAQRTGHGQVCRALRTSYYPSDPEGKWAHSKTVLHACAPPHRSLRREKADAPWDYHHFATAQSVAAVANAGGSVHAGAHGQMQVMH